MIAQVTHRYVNRPFVGHDRERTWCEADTHGLPRVSLRVEALGISNGVPALVRPDDELVPLPSPLREGTDTCQQAFLAANCDTLSGLQT